MIEKNESPNRLLSLSIDQLLDEAREAVNDKNMARLHAIDRMVKRDFSKKLANQQLNALKINNHEINKFLIDFDWGGRPQWSQAESMVSGWKALLELSLQITHSESPEIAYRELKKTKYGEQLVVQLYEHRVLNPTQLKETLRIKSKQQVTNLLRQFEKQGIIAREADGKNVWVTLGKQGIAVYKTYIEEKLKADRTFTLLSEAFITALQAFENGNYQEAIDELNEIRMLAPDNPFVLCLLAVLNMELNEMNKAGELFEKLIACEFDKSKAQKLFYLFDKIKKAQILKKCIVYLAFQEDAVSARYRPLLTFVGLYSEAQGNAARAHSFYELAGY